MKSEKSDLLAINTQAGHRSDMPIQNYNVTLPVSAMAGAYASILTKVCSRLGQLVIKSYTSVERPFLQHQGVEGSRGRKVMELGNVSAGASYLFAFD